MKKKQNKRNPRGIPSVVRIGGLEWHIVAHPDSFVGDDQALGVCRRMKKTIEVAALPDLADTEVQDTVLHEILHAIAYQLGLFDEQDEEERVVRTLSTALLGVIKDNPKLLAYLSG